MINHVNTQQLSPNRSFDSNMSSTPNIGQDILNSKIITWTTSRTVVNVKFGMEILQFVVLAKQS